MGLGVYLYLLNGEETEPASETAAAPVSCSGAIVLAIEMSPTSSMASLPPPPDAARPPPLSPPAIALPMACPITSGMAARILSPKLFPVIAERVAALRHHGDLYLGDEREAWLRIEAGRLRVGSLATAGYGVAFDPDLASMIPLDRWSFDSLTAGPGEAG